MQSSPISSEGKAFAQTPVDQRSVVSSVNQESAMTAESWADDDDEFMQLVGSAKKPVPTSGTKKSEWKTSVPTSSSRATRFTPPPAVNAPAPSNQSGGRFDALAPTNRKRW